MVPDMVSVAEEIEDDEDDVFLAGFDIISLSVLLVRDVAIK